MRQLLTDRRPLLGFGPCGRRATVAALTLLALTPAAAAAQNITTVAGTGTAGFSGDGGAATAAQLAIPLGVAVAGDGGYFIADQANNRIRRVTPGGTISTVAGMTMAGFSGDGGPATAAQFDALNAVTVLTDGSLVVADSNNNRVRRFTVGGNVTTVAGNGMATISGDGGPATMAAVRFPADVAALPDGGYLIADTDNHRIRRVTAGGTISTVAGTTQGFGGDGGPATAAAAGLSKPSGVSPTADGGFLIADTDNHRIRKVSAGGTITTVAGTGATGSSGDGGAATAATLNLPTRVAALPDGGFVISDRGAHRVRQVSAAGVITPVAGTGTAGATGDGGPATSAQLNTPYGVAVTAGGDVLIADALNHKVRRVGAAGVTGSTPAVIDADVASVSGNVARGSLAGRTMTLSGSVVDGSPGSSTVDGSGTLFAAPEFGIPGLAHSDEIAIQGLNGYGYQLTFATPVTDPVLAIGSLASRLDFTTGTSITRLRGQGAFTVSGASVSGALGNSGPLTDANGVVRLNGTFSTITFTATPLFSGGTIADGIYVLPALATGTPFTPQLVRWPLDTGYSAKAKDFSGNGGDGTTLAGSTAAAGRFGKALTLSAPGDGFELTGQLEPAGSFTLVSWVRSASSPGADKAIVAKGGRGCRDQSYALNTGANGGLEFSVQLPGPVAAGSTVVRTPLIAPSSIWDGAWHAVAGVYDIASGGTTRSVTLWVDGQPVGVQGVPEGPGPTIDYFSAHILDRQLTVGHLPADCSPDRSFTGQLDELRLYDAALDRRQLSYLQRPDHVIPPNLDGDTSPVNTSRPVLSGTPLVGSDMGCTTGGWTGAAGTPTYTTVWERAPRSTTSENDPGWAPIDGATGTTYTVQAVDAGSRIRCRVTRTDPGGNADAPSRSLRADAGAPANSAAPFLTGLAASVASPTQQPGLICNPGTWSDGPDFAYQWLRNGAEIAGATRSTYRPKPTRAPNGPPNTIADGDGQQQVSCRVTASNDVGSDTAASEQVLSVDGVPLNAGLPQVTYVRRPAGVSDAHNEATCKEGAWVDGYGLFRTNPYVYRYEWLRNGSVIAGATDSRYTFTDEDLGRDISCRVVDTNPLGDSKPATSPVQTLLLPTGPSTASVLRAGGVNSADPTNLLAVSDRYAAAIDSVVVDRLEATVATYKTGCKSSYTGPKTAPEQPTGVEFLNRFTKCRVLLYDADHVSITSHGVRYLDGRCTPLDKQKTRTQYVCQNIGFKIPAIDPANPPAADADVLARVSPATPETILWDLDGDGKTDAACPGSAPVLRTILNDGDFKARAVIVDSISKTDLRYPNATLDFHAGPAGGRAGLRKTQVKVCATSFVPPPNPQTTPCITSGTIGRVQVTGDLCPIDARDITKDDFAALEDDTKALLTAASEHRLYGEGKATSRAAGAAAEGTTWVPLTPPSRRAHLRSITSDLVRTQTAALSNTAASLSSLGSQATAKVTSAADYSKTVNDIDSFKAAKANFALNQIYVASGAGMVVNGVSIKPLEKSLALLVPSDVHDGLTQVNAMTVNARNALQQLGPLTDPKSIPLAAEGALKATIDDAKSRATAELKQLNFDQLKGYADKLDLGPFKLAGNAKVTLNGDGTATLRAFAELPGLKAGPTQTSIRTDVTVTGDLQGRLHLQGLHFKAGLAYLGAAKLEKLDFAFDNGRLDIKGAIDIPPPASAGIEIKEFSVDKGGPQALSVDYFAGPGGGIPAGPGVYITRLGAGFSRYTNILEGNTTVSVGPSPNGGCAALGMTASFQVHVAELFSLDAHGNLNVACVPLLNANLHADQTGYVHFDAGIDWSAGPVFIKGTLDAGFRMPNWQVGFTVTGGVRHVPLLGTVDADIEAVLSNRGLAVCGKIDVLFATIAAGAAEPFHDGRPPLSVPELIANLKLFRGCDISAYRSVVARSARADQPGAATFTLAGTTPVLLSFEGAGAAPRVILHGPGGETLDYSDATGDRGKKVGDSVGSVIETEDRSVVILGKHAAGTWKASLADGSPAILRTEQATILPKPKVTATVLGRGATRTLKYDVGAISGQSVRFVEQAKGGQTIIKTVKGGGKGQARFTVSEADSPVRTIEAQVLQDNTPRANLTVARFVAPSPRVGMPVRVRVRRAGRQAAVTWGPAALAKAYEVTVTYGVGRTVVLEPKPGIRRVVVPGVVKGEGLKIGVVAFSPSGRRSPVANGTLGGNMRVGAKVKKRPAKQQKR